MRHFGYYRNRLKEVIITLYEKIKQEHKKLEEQIKSLKSEISNYPSGKILIKRDGKYHKWYHVNNKTKTYIPKKNKQFIERMVIKEYLNSMYEDVSKEYYALGAYLNKHSKVNKVNKLINAKPMFVEYIRKRFKPLSEELNEWMNEKYETNNKHPEHLVHRTASGKYVRSKSESIIANLLEKYSIPYKYECKLELNGTIIYPDFTIRHPKTGEIYYWEHLGLADDSNYFRNSLSKLELFAANGIVPTINLITTYETKYRPMDATYVEMLIKHFFCD